MISFEIPDDLVPGVARAIRLGALIYKFQNWNREDDTYRLLDGWATAHGAPKPEPDEITKSLDRFLERWDEK